MLACLSELIPGANEWPTLKRNVSSQFEARVSLVKVLPSNCIFLEGMNQTIAPIAIAHGEGRFGMESISPELEKLVCLQYATPNGEIAGVEDYPYNPNGSLNGVAGITSPCGRFLAMMPHPERVVRDVCNTWKEGSLQVFGPWMKMFWNAREWCEREL